MKGIYEQIINKQNRCFVVSITKSISYKKNKIVFSSYMGRGYGDEGKIIIEAVGEKVKKYDIVWLCYDINGYFPPFIRPVKFNSLQSAYELATAKLWIDNRRKSRFIRKKEEKDRNINGEREKNAKK